VPLAFFITLWATMVFSLAVALSSVLVSA